MVRLVKYEVRSRAGTGSFFIFKMTIKVDFKIIGFGGKDPLEFLDCYHPEAFVPRTAATRAQITTEVAFRCNLREW
jgi:hypothetical protein